MTLLLTKGGSPSTYTDWQVTTDISADTVSSAGQKREFRWTTRRGWERMSWHDLRVPYLPYKRLPLLFVRDLSVRILSSILTVYWYGKWVSTFRLYFGTSLSRRVSMSPYVDSPSRLILSLMSQCRVFVRIGFLVECGDVNRRSLGKIYFSLNLK